MAKKLIKVAIALVVVLVIAVLVGWMMINSIARTAIEEGGTYALDVPVKVKSIDIALLGGKVGVDGMTIANVPKFDEPHLMALNEFRLEVESGSLMGDTIKVPLISLDGLDVYYIKKDGGDNIEPILANLERFKSKDTGEGEGEGETKPDEPTKEEPKEATKFIVDKLIIKNVTAHLDVPVLGKKTVTIPEIKLEGLTQDNAEGLAMSELTARIVPAIMASVFNFDGVKTLIPDLANGLVTQIGNVDKLAADIGGKAAEVAEQLVTEAGKVVEDVTKEAGKVVEDVAEKGGEAVKDIGKGLDDAGKKVGEGIGGAIKGILGDDEKKE